MDASLFVDDAEACDKYQRDEEQEVSEQMIIMITCFKLARRDIMFSTFHKSTY